MGIIQTNREACQITFRPRLHSLTTLVLALVLLGGAYGATPASAAFGIESFDGLVTDAQGRAYTQAGGHPYAASTAFAVNSHAPDGVKVPDGGGLKEVVVDLPVGFGGDPTATPTCSPAEFVALPTTIATNCPASSQVGVATPDFILGPLADFPLYNLKSATWSCCSVWVQNHQCARISRRKCASERLWRTGQRPQCQPASGRVRIFHHPLGRSRGSKP